MTVQLPTDLANFVQESIESGAYGSEQDVVIRAMHVLRELTERHEQLRKDIQLGIDQLDRGESTTLDIEKIRAEGMKRLAGRPR